MKKQKGITLIALIITIIVMLILVGVTINVAINGGLIEKAKSAADETKKQTVYETILSSIVLTNSGDINPVATKSAALSALNATGIESYDLLEDFIEAGEEIPNAPVSVIAVKPNQYYLITHSRIIKDFEVNMAAMETEDYEGVFNEKLTWDDLAITNVTKNAVYAGDFEISFAENENGITFNLGDETSWGNNMLALQVILGVVQIPQDNHFVAYDDGEFLFECILKGNTMEFIDGEGNTHILTKE